MIIVILPVQAAEFEVNGTVHQSSPQTPGSRQEHSFRVSVAGDRWNIRLLPTSYTPEENGFSPIIPDYLEAGNNGTNFFSVTSVESGADDPKRPGAITYSAFAVRGEGRIPFGIDPVITGIWWTYASHRYLEKKKVGRIIVPDSALPLRLVGIRMTNDFEVPATWRLNDEAPFLPGYITTSNYVPHFGGRHTFELLLGGTTTNFALAVREWNNVAGLKLPKVAKIEYYYPIRKGDRNNGPIEWKHRSSTTIAASEFKTKVSVVNFVPELPPRSSVMDYRRLSRSPPDDPKSELRSTW
ncbi:MAG TPA: hypothetical protein VF773_06405 [Verrucomicrobiae bacterium]